MEDIHHILKKYWSYDTFRPLQADIIKAVLAGNDVLALLPTGGGKSICFQVPGLARPGVCLVITPLIALMKDQVAQLNQRNIPAAALFTGLSQQTIDLVLDNCIYGHTKFLYLSPERLQTAIFKVRVRKMQVNLLAIDEAHCISAWGYDFRPAYLAIADLRQCLSGVNVLAVTATATPAVKQDIQDKLAFKKPVVFQQSFSRSNLGYQVRKTEDKSKNLLQLLKKAPGSAIIYVNTRKKTKLISQFLVKNHMTATYYHGGLDNLQRQERQDGWMTNQVKVIVATNAFGMGIDKPDVRLVLHLDLPATLEAYYQEAGRAGRDGLQAYAIVLYDDQDVGELRESIQKNNLPIIELKNCYQQLANYYQLAIGAADRGPYTLDLEQFCKTTKRPLESAYQAIKQLAAAGIIDLNEAFGEPSTVLLHIRPPDIHPLRPKALPHQLLLEALLRLYGAELFTDFCAISETKLAAYLQLQSAQVHEQFYKLHQAGLLTYRAQTNQPQITFLHPRQPTHHLPVDTAALKAKAERAIQKAEAVIHYVTHQHRCRAQILLEYFAEVSYQPCKQCDRCRLKVAQATIPADLAIEDLILQRLAKAACSPAELLEHIDSPEERVLASIRQLLERGAITYNLTQCLVKNPPTD